MLRKATLLPGSKSAHGETIVIELEENNEVINATVEVSDLYLNKYPAVSEGHIPENLFNELVKKALSTTDITDGCTIRISSPNTSDPSVDCMVSVVKK